MFAQRCRHQTSRSVVTQRCRTSLPKLSVGVTRAEPIRQRQSISSFFPNLRDVAEIAPELAQLGRLYRTACPVSATDDQMLQLFERGVTTLIDLRAPEEIDQYGEPSILKQATVWGYPRKDVGPFTSPSVSAVPITSDARATNGGASSSPESPDSPTIEVHRLSLLDRKRYVKRLMVQIPPLDAARALVYQVWDMEASEAVLMRGNFARGLTDPCHGGAPTLPTMCRNINDGGVAMLYEIMLRTSTVEIGATMQVILGALEQGHSVMFYCKAGKDRTGIVAALLLSVLGASDDAIIRDYVLSDPHGDMALGSVAGGADLRKLDREVFSRAPADAMAATLAFLRSEYGSAEGYLAACGFQQGEQERLKQLLRPAATSG